MTSAAADDVSHTQRTHPLGPSAVALCLLTAALWGGTPVAISYSVDQLPPVAVAAIRFAMAAAFMLVWCRWEGSRLGVPAGQRWLVAAGGGLLFFQIWFFNLGVAWSNSSHGSVLINTFVLGVKIVFTRHAVRKIPPGAFIFWHDVIGVALFAVWSLSFETISVRRLEVPTVLALVYQGLVVAGFCFAVQARLLRRHPASQISIFSTATPLFGIMFAAYFRGDRLSPWLLASAACVAAGILLVNASRAGAVEAEALS